jgi:hypothetical protein
MSNGKQVSINITLKDLFKRWLEITSSFHKLPKQQQNILALFLYYHYEFKKDITNDKILWKMVFDYDTKMKIKQELGIGDQTMQNTITKLRKKNIIVDNVITPVFIPDLSLNSKSFKIVFNFNII